MAGELEEWVTTTALLEQLHDFEDEVWSGFAQRFHPLLVDFARRGGVAPAESEDVAQEVLLAFADAYRRGTFERTRGGLRAWMFSIARNKITDWHRRQGTRRGHQETVGDRSRFWDDVQGDEAWVTWQQAWEQVLLELCLARARREFRDATFRAFELVALQGEPPKVVAQQLGLTENAVFIAKHRVLTRVRELARDCEIDELGD